MPSYKICPVCGISFPVKPSHESRRTYCGLACYRSRPRTGPSFPFLVQDRGYRTPCHIWQGAKNRGRYGMVTFHDGLRRRTMVAHKYIWERRHGPVPTGLELDHLCRVPSCVNPDHLEPVTHFENCRRGASPAMVAHRTGRCQRGHKMTPENTYTFPGSGARTCRTCMRGNDAPDNRGENHGQAVLRADEVRIIRRRYASGTVTMRTLALAFGVSESNVRSIIHRVTWAHLPDEVDTP